MTRILSKPWLPSSKNDIIPIRKSLLTHLEIPHQLQKLHIIAVLVPHLFRLVTSSLAIHRELLHYSVYLHPDANVSNAKRASSDKSFIQLLEAYKVLSKPDSRASYDYELSLRERPYGQQVRYNKSFTFKRKQLDDFSRKNALQHAEVRAEAESLGNDAQLERMKATLKKEVIW
ncbi:conserved hypothetical protein [Culex quinquefasciatus]|uniref:J domain-containing protein n=1 Tax=Culex quinquefasciatus TaxID=7176 RepID=B0X7B0_CULQU|nr:conserved hypothetical protein [Culex quinquefasciatus]|eukprot:XP_001865526.1 conserved hypothetical protein [Culex quinquefasciatus]